MGSSPATPELSLQSLKTKIPAEAVASRKIDEGDFRGSVSLQNKSSKNFSASPAPGDEIAKVISLKRRRHQRDQSA